MLALSLVLRPRLNRLLNIVLSLVHFVTILASCIGATWVYYLVGSLIEATLLAAIAVTARRWPRAGPPASGDHPMAVILHRISTGPAHLLTTGGISFGA